MATENKTIESSPAITIRFAGDSGDGMQLVGTRFTDTSALFGNDLATLPAFPAEIRAPQGTIAGVSSFQVQIADFDILTPGDNPDVLVAMNPAALKAHLHDLTPNGMLILNEDAFDEKNIESEKTQIYLLQRCSSIYAFASGVLMKSDSLQSKKLIEISNNLLFKSVELMVIEEQKSLEVSQKHSEDIRKRLFNNYIADGKQNWERNKSYFKGKNC